MRLTRLKIGRRPLPRKLLREIPAIPATFVTAYVGTLLGEGFCRRPSAVSKEVGIGIGISFLRQGESS